MSAYTGGPVTLVPGPIKKASLSTDDGESEGLLPPLPELSKIDHQLGSYFQVARSLEAALVQYRAQAQKLAEDLKLLETQHTQTKFDLETRYYETQQREEQLKVVVKTFEKNIKHLQARTKEFANQNSLLNEERKRLAHNNEIYKAHLDASTHREDSLKAVVENLQATEKMHAASLLQLQTQISDYERREKQHQDHIQNLTQELETLRRADRKNEVDEGIWSAKVDYHRKREQSVAGELEQSRRNVQLQGEDIKRLTDESHRVRQELNHYKSQWPNVSALQEKSAQMSKTNHELQENLQKVSEQLERFKNQLAHAEELRNKEKRDKQIALNCLHTAESKIEELTQEIDAMKTRAAAVAAENIPSLKIL